MHHHCNGSTLHCIPQENETRAGVLQRSLEDTDSKVAPLQEAIAAVSGNVTGLHGCCCCSSRYVFVHVLVGEWEMLVSQQ